MGDRLPSEYALVAVSVITLVARMKGADLLGIRPDIDKLSKRLRRLGKNLSDVKADLDETSDSLLKILEMDTELDSMRDMELRDMDRRLEVIETRLDI